MIELTLYGTVGCHLCEVAEELLATMLADPCRGASYRIELVDIADCGELLERYGTSIPVLKKQLTGEELNWPFDMPLLIDFL